MAEQLEQQIEKILPEDLARTFESAYHVIQGDNEHVEELLRHGGALLRKVSKRFTPTQIVLGIAALAIGTVIVLSRYSEQIGDAIEDLTDGDGDQNKQGQGQGQKGQGGKPAGQAGQ
jgi:recombination associated protein RdgC